MTQTERGQMAQAYHAAADVVRRRPDSGFAHFAMSYVLRYAGLLEESARECDEALRLDPHDYRIRSCAITFEMLGRYDRGRVFANLDPDSDSGIWRFIYLDLDQGRTSEARQLLVRHSGAWSARLLAAHLDKAPPEQLAELSRRAEVVTAALIDSEEYYYNARCQAYTQHLEAALRQLRFAISANYCSYPSMDSDPLLTNIRGLSEFKELRKAGIACRETFRSQMADH